MFLNFLEPIMQTNCDLHQAPSVVSVPKPAEVSVPKAPPPRKYDLVYLLKLLAMCSIESAQEAIMIYAMHYNFIPHLLRVCHPARLLILAT